MEDFASAAMMRLVALGLARQGVAIAAPAGAHVPHADKRATLERVLAAHGPGAILAIADAARDMPAEPVVQALTAACDVADLLDRWRRLERFSHARHRIATEPLGAGRHRLTHQARGGGPTPAVAETLLVAGVVAALAEGVEGRAVRLATETGEVWRADGAWRAPAVGEVAGPLVLTVEERARSTPTPRADCAPDEDALGRLRRLVAADPVRRRPLAELAAEIGVSTRTLQRHLATRSTSASRLARDARLEVAARLLRRDAAPGLAEIGFLAGFADQAHFARAFRDAVGTTPSAYRAQFGG